MARAPRIIPISDLRQNASNIVKTLSSSREPVFIAQRGRAAAVMVSIEAYKDSQYELEILRLFARGEKEIEAGVCCEFDDVLKKADRLLEAARH
jgi:prevent-host-death family protein